MNDRRLPVLEDVRIAAPCAVAWDSMEGDDRVRFCGDCSLNVYNLSGMTRDEAEALLRANAGTGDRLCVGLYRRADGTIITRDCPVGLRALRRKATAAMARVAVAITLAITTSVVFALGRRDREGDLRNAEPYRTICTALAPPAPVFTGGVMLPIPGPPPGPGTRPITPECETSP